jgi:phosphoribosylformylglycinamidine synthase
MYRRPAFLGTKERDLLSFLRFKVDPAVNGIETETCFYIESGMPLLPGETEILRWLLSETFEPDNFSGESFLEGHKSLSDNLSGFQGDCTILEVGPRMNFTTAWSTNAVSICHACGLTKIRRIEHSRRFKIFSSAPLDDLRKGIFVREVHDRMTECLYPARLTAFETAIKPRPVYRVRLIEEGRVAIEKINRDLGLGLDDWDIQYYYDLFSRELGRNPTNVECFDLAQSNSEHSRHWFFKGNLIIDGICILYTLMDVIRGPYEEHPNNSVIAFRDNSSAIRGCQVTAIVPERAGRPSPFVEKRSEHHITFTAETHNFPSGVAPFPGAETGTGGRIRDVQAVGRGGLVIAGTAAYCVGNLDIAGYVLPWERIFAYPGNLARPLRIEIEASNGASDYGNKFGEPVIQGFTRSFGMRLPDGERREWIKPIMFTGGVGQMDARHVEKGRPRKGMLVVKVGGPAYRIGIGGGAASSMIQGENIEDLDFSAVQRGDAEMEQKLNRVIRSCIEMGDKNPVISIHDQGAGGNCNVIKELVYPEGAYIEARKIILGDETLSVLEIWGAEYQESNALLIEAEKASFFEEVCKREKVPFAVIGFVTGDGYLVLYDAHDKDTPVNLDLGKVLGKMPKKRFVLERRAPRLVPLSLPEDLTVTGALERVLRLLSVGSKRFLTNKVDRSVTGLIARQQCTGPFQLTVSDVAVIAQGHFGVTGAAISIGEQPIKGLINPAAMARMAVAEAITNIIWARVSDLADIRCSANWMWPAKLPGEGAALYDAAVAMAEMMRRLGIAVDGGKDSISMAAVVTGKDGEKEIVKAPGSLVISAYVTCPDITKVITPDIKGPGMSKLLLIDLGAGNNRLGGSALAHVFGQIGDESPDIEDPDLLKRTFSAVQNLIDKGLILSGHDRSDGGLLVTLLEMAFSGNCGFRISMKPSYHGAYAFPILFSEEAGLVIEYHPVKEGELFEVLAESGVPYQGIGMTLEDKVIEVEIAGMMVLRHDMRRLREIWEETSYHLERLQSNPECADEERTNIFDRKAPKLHLTFTPEQTPRGLIEMKEEPRVAIVREEGSNGDREMISAFYHAGFETWDVTMTDIINGDASLDDFRGVAFVGGFSYADVLDSAKGWAGVIRFNKRVYDQFQGFYHRKDTFSLGVCNGCQLMALLGWVPWRGIEDRFQPRFIRNRSGRFESRFSAVKILSSPSIFFRGMEGSVLGIWVAHGEGRVCFPGAKIEQGVILGGLAPLRYVDDEGEITEAYPFNPNGSPMGIAALCTPDGRHLALMPHPERTFMKWQWPWMPAEWSEKLAASPWLRLFQNAREWCRGNPEI